MFSVCVKHSLIPMYTIRRYIIIYSCKVDQVLLTPSHYPNFKNIAWRPGIILKTLVGPRLSTVNTKDNAQNSTAFSVKGIFRYLQKRYIVLRKKEPKLGQKMQNFVRTTSLQYFEIVSTSFQHTLSTLLAQHFSKTMMLSCQSRT